VIRCAKEQWHGEVEIHYITKRPYAFLLEHNPYIDKVHRIDRSTNEIIDTLREIQFDYVLDLHHNARSYFLKRKLKALSFSFSKLNKEKWLLVNFGINQLPDVHIVDRYMDTLRAFKIENDGKGLDYFLPDEDRVELHTLPPEFASGYIAFVIGGQHRGKKLPPKKIASVCSQLNYPVVLLGGKEDEDAADQIIEQSSGVVWSAAGKFNFNQSASLIEQSTGVITHDTGLMHVAAAFKKPIVSVWGGTVPAFGMYPYLPGEPSHIAEARHLTKRPCSKLGNRCKYKPCLCVEEINESEIVEHAIRTVSSAR
jgi:ADP-heptose:LPS heptosyltransferase